MAATATKIATWDLTTGVKSKALKPADAESSFSLGKSSLSEGAFIDDERKIVDAKDITKGGKYRCTFNLDFILPIVIYELTPDCYSNRPPVHPLRKARQERQASRHWDRLAHIW